MAQRIAKCTVRHLWPCVPHACHGHTPHVRRGKPVVREMEYSSRSDCLVVQHEDLDKAFYRGIIVLDLAVGRVLYSVSDLGCALHPLPRAQPVGALLLGSMLGSPVRCAAQAGQRHCGVHAAGQRLWQRAVDRVCPRRR